MYKIAKPLVLFLILCVSVVLLSSCASKNNTSSKVTVTEAPTAEVIAKATKAPTEKPTVKQTAKPTVTPKKTTNSSTKSSSSSSYRTSFTNKYGTATTKCAHPGCNNYIASSGDTNCCPTHSRRCLECGKYIDEDAAYCMDCIRKALGQ